MMEITLPFFIQLIVAIIVIGTVAWGATEIIKALAIGEPYKRVALVLIVVFSTLLIISLFFPSMSLIRFH